MKLFEILNPNCLCEEVFLDQDRNIISEAAIRQYKRTDKKIVPRYRCLAGPKAGKLVSNAGDCAHRKDPRKVRLGRKIMRMKKGVIIRKGEISKQKGISKIVTRMNQRLMGTLPAGQ